VSGGVHTPQSTVAPQPSATTPQLSPVGQPAGVQFGMPHWLGTPPPPQVAGGVHIPQSIWLPQPSPAIPQPMFCCMHDSGEQLPVMHWPLEPQVADELQLPQLAVTPPQPSPQTPHEYPRLLQSCVLHALPPH